MRIFIQTLRLLHANDTDVRNGFTIYIVFKSNLVNNGKLDEVTANTHCGRPPVWKGEVGSVPVPLLHDAGYQGGG